MKEIAKERARLHSKESLLNFEKVIFRVRSLMDYFRDFYFSLEFQGKNSL